MRIPRMFCSTASSKVLARDFVCATIHIFLMFVCSAFALADGERIILLDLNGDGGFRNGSTFGSNNWTVVNGVETNKWEVGDQIIGFGGGRVRGAYVSPDGGATWSFNVNDASIVHFYRDIFVPSDADEVYLQFQKWGFTTPFFDELFVYVVPTSTTILPGVLLTAQPIRLEKSGLLVDFGVESALLSVNAGSEFRLVFTWTNSGNGQGKQPPVGIRSVEVSFTRRNPLRDKMSWQNPKPHGNDHENGVAINSNTAIATGDAGTVGKTTDGGATWNFTHNVNGLRVPFVSPIRFGQDIFLVAQPNILLRSTDQGQSFDPFSLINTDSTQVNGITSDGQVFLGVGNGGSIYRSTNGGTNWTPTTSGVAQNLNSVSFISGSPNAVIAGGQQGMVIKSTNAGLDWDTTNVGISPTTQIMEIGSYGNGTLAIAGSPGLYRSTDGGSNWTQVIATGGMSLSGLDLSDNGEGIAVGGSSTVLHTTDFWASASFYNTGTNDFLADASIFPGGLGYSIVGEKGRLFFTSDFISFPSFSSGITNDLNAVSFDERERREGQPLRTLTGWAAGRSGTVLKTTDGGNNWTALSTGFFGTLEGITSSAGLVMAVGSPNQNIRSTDGGATWSMMSLPTSLGLTDIDLIDSVSAIAVGAAGSAFITRDGGQTWSPRTTGVTSFLNSVDVFARRVTVPFVADTFSAIAVGNFGTILQSTDGGNSWQVLSSPTNANLLDVQMLDELNGYAVGVGGTVLRTTNGGQNWTQFSVASPSTLTSTSFIAPDIGIVAVRTGLLLRTLDGAVTWDTLLSPTSNELSSIIMLDPYSAVAAGASGTIIGAAPETTIVVVGVREPSFGQEIPTHFSLEQNYPNPFNPSTMISYHLPTQGHVVLRMYDLLGREVATLVNETKEPGSYEATWDAERVGSGVYFYRLQAGEFVQTRRMLLLK